jgi:hypothetical protein
MQENTAKTMPAKAVMVFCFGGREMKWLARLALGFAPFSGGANALRGSSPVGRSKGENTK